MSILNAERSQSVEQSLTQIKRIIDRLGLSINVEIKDQSFQTTYLSISDGFGTEISSGSGKGRYSFIGALAESVEHVAHSLGLTLSPMKAMSIKDISRQPSLKNDGFFQSFKDVQEALTVVQEFISVEDNSKCYVPISYTRPDFPKSNYVNETEIVTDRIARYSSNSGTAFGITKVDALLHGVNEIIERHILSQLYLDILGFDCDVEFHKLPMHSLSKENQDVIGLLTEKFKASFDILLANTHFNNWCAIAILKSNKPEIVIPQVGSGSSYFLEIALARAIGEISQACSLYTNDEKAEDDISRTIAQQFEKLENVVYLPERVLNYPIIESLPDKPEIIHPEQQWGKISIAMKNQGHPLFYTDLANFDELGYVVQVFSPGLDRFHLVRSGNLVAPQATLRESI